MTEASAERARTPWHLWAVGVIGLPWNGFGAFDFAATQIGGEEYLRNFGMNEAQIAYFHAMPWWMTVMWALGTWGGLIGAVLLLLRSRWAFHAFAISLAAFVMSLVYTYGMSNGGEVAGGNYAINAVILTGCLFFLWYAWAMTKRGVLR